MSNAGTQTTIYRNFILSISIFIISVSIFNTPSQQEKHSTRTRSWTFGMFYMQHFSQVLLLQQL